jgi:glycosyltransferase involved in cell wall biosynthesis
MACLHISDHSEDKDRAGLGILLAGPFPSPIGGISVHIHRLSSWLSAQGIKVDLVDETKHKKKGVYNIRGLRFLSYLQYLLRCNVAHIQSSVHLFRIFHIVMCRLFGLRVIVTIHSWRPGGIITPINKIFLKMAHEVVLVSEQLNDYLKLKNYHVIPAFLPPTNRGQNLPEEIKCFIYTVRKRGDYLICANAYEMIEHNGQDLYGLDLCVELMDLLTNKFNMKAAFVFVISYHNQRSQLYLNAQKIIKEQGLEDRFFLYDKPLDFITLMEKCDLVLRPTNTDGDALTIREALYLGLPVIASDAVRRPQGTILFRNRDAKDLMRYTVDILKGGACPICVPAETDYNSYFYKYLDLYLGVLNRKRRKMLYEN